MKATDIVDLALSKITKGQKRNRCADMDMDCREVKDKLGCYLYAPELGECPFVKSWYQGEL